MKENHVMKKYKIRYIDVIRKYIGLFIWIPGSILLYYIWSTQNQIMFSEMGFFTTILPFCFSITSWIIGAILYFRENKITDPVKWHIISYSCCVLAIWMFLLDVDCKMRVGDVSSLRDLSMYYSCTSLFIFLMTTWINVKSYIKREESILTDDLSCDK